MSAKNFHYHYVASSSHLNSMYDLFDLLHQLHNHLERVFYVFTSTVSHLQLLQPTIQLRASLSRILIEHLHHLALQLQLDLRDSDFTSAQRLNHLAVKINQMEFLHHRQPVQVVSMPCLAWLFTGDVRCMHSYWHAFCVKRNSDDFDTDRASLYTKHDT